MEIRNERPGDEAAIAALVEQAFQRAAHSDGTEAAIVARLRAAGALALSLVAVDAEGEIVGQIAFSPVMVDGRDRGWFGLGPVAVAPERQRSGVGAALIAAGLDRLRASGASGCVVLGEPDYYSRYGFQSDPRISYPGPPPQYFQMLSFRGDPPTGVVSYHSAFG